jgi:hypothetical protein
MAIDLEPKPLVDRWPAATARPAAGEHAPKTILLVGSSHASKLSDALRALGHRVELLFEPNWRAWRNNITAMANRIAGKLAELKLDLVIFFMLDNNVYYALQEDGNTCPSRKDNTGCFHVDGDLFTCSKSAQHILFNQLKLMLELAKNKNCVLVSPLPRYIKVGCCTDAEHMANRATEGFERQLLQDLKEMAENFRDFAFTAGYRHFKILDPQVSWRGLGRDEVWANDPIHPTTAAYKKLAEGAMHLDRHM